jgi:hypothetical protein
MTDAKHIIKADLAGISVRIIKLDQDYFNANDMCRTELAFKLYMELAYTKTLVKSLSADGPIINLDGDSWFHPKLAIHLALWLDNELYSQLIDYINAKPAALKTPELRCEYCNKKSPSASAAVKHMEACRDMAGREFKAVISLSRFMSYVELMDNYVIGVDLTMIDWSSDKPKLLVEEPGFAGTFNIYLNESRWRMVRLLNKHVYLPMNMLLSKKSLKMFNENQSTLQLMQQYFSRDIDFSFEEEFKDKLGLEH